MMRYNSFLRVSDGTHGARLGRKGAPPMGEALGMGQRWPHHQGPVPLRARASLSGPLFCVSGRAGPVLAPPPADG